MDANEIETPVPDCTECEHCESQDIHQNDSEGRRHFSHTAHECRATFPNVVNGVKTCELMRSTVCGVYGKEFIQIDWEARKEEKRTLDIKRARQKQLMKTISFFVYKPWLFFVYLCVPVFGWLALLGHWLIWNSMARDDLFDEKYEWDDKKEDYRRQ